MRNGGALTRQRAEREEERLELRDTVARLRRLLTIEHYRNSAHDFLDPWPKDCPYCVAIHPALPRRYVGPREYAEMLNDGGTTDV